MKRAKRPRAVKDGIVYQQCKICHRWLELDTRFYHKRRRPDLDLPCRQAGTPDCTCIQCRKRMRERTNRLLRKKEKRLVACPMCREPALATEVINAKGHLRPCCKCKQVLQSGRRRYMAMASRNYPGHEDRMRELTERVAQEKPLFGNGKL